MKVYKYLTVLLAFAAMSATFISCDKDVDPDVDAKQNYWIDFTLSSAGSLSNAAQSRFIELRDTTIYGEKGIKIIEHPMYCTLDYAQNNFNAVAALANEDNDIVQKIMIPTFCVDTIGGVCHNDFVVTMTLSKDSMNTVIATHSWSASTAFDGQALINQNR